MSSQALSKADIKSFHENGYLICKNPRIIELKNIIRDELRAMSLIILKKYFSEEIYHHVNGLPLEGIVDYCVSIEKKNSISKVLYNLFTTNHVFIGMSGDRFFIDISNQLGLDYPIPSTLPLIRLDRSRDETYLVPSHQDFWFSMNCPSSVTYWFSLTQLCSKMGYLKAIPGSHLSGLLPIQEFSSENPFVLREDPPEHEYTDIQLGDDEILVFSQLLVHKSAKNESDGTRISVQIRHNDLANLTHLGSSFIVNNSPMTLGLQSGWLTESLLRK
jgi:hypothetical protein